MLNQLLPAVITYWAKGINTERLEVQPPITPLIYYAYAYAIELSIQWQGIKTFSFKDNEGSFWNGIFLKYFQLKRRILWGKGIF